MLEYKGGAENAAEVKRVGTLNRGDPGGLGPRAQCRGRAIKGGAHQRSDDRRALAEEAMVRPSGPEGSPIIYRGERRPPREEACSGGLRQSPLTDRKKGNTSRPRPCASHTAEEAAYAAPVRRGESGD